MKNELNKKQSSPAFVATAQDANWTSVLRRLAALELRVFELETKLKEKEAIYGNDPGTTESK